MIESIKLWFSRALPEPSRKNFNVQVGVHFEEVVEMLDTLEGVDDVTDNAVERARNSLRLLSVLLKQGEGEVTIISRKDYLDALCDQIVTATGCGHTAGVDVVRGIERVNRSNFSKFDKDGQPIFDANGKITKGPDYVKPDLTGLY